MEIELIDMETEIEITPKPLNPFDNSRPLDVHRWSEYPEVKKATDAICKELGLVTDKQKIHCRVILLDLYHCCLTDPTMYIGVSLNSRSYEMDERYNKLFIKYDVLAKVVTKLIETGYSEFQKGFKDRDSGFGRQTRIQATTKLVELVESCKVTKEMLARCEDEEIILLRDKPEDKGKKTGKRKVKIKQQNIAYLETAHTRRLRNGLQAYNELLSKTDITLNCENHSIDLTRKKLYRIFCNGTWTQGGRLYGSFWTECKKELRQNILINGKPTKECDFKCMHMHLLYALENINYADKQEDAYTIEGYEGRDLFKQLLLISLNSKKAHKGIMALIDKSDELSIADYPYLNTALKVFTKKHQQVAHLFFKELGTTLQYFDSLIAEDVVEHYTKNNIPVLTVHDSFIIQGDLVDDLVARMLVSFYKVVKFYTNSKGKLVHGMYMPYNPNKEYLELINRIPIDIK